MSELERSLKLCLEPVRAPESIWYRVEAELFPAPARPRSVLRPAIAVLLALAISAAAWTMTQRRTSLASAPQPRFNKALSVHACTVCHG